MVQVQGMEREEKEGSRVGELGQLWGLEKLKLFKFKKCYEALRKWRQRTKKK